MQVLRININSLLVIFFIMILLLGISFFSRASIPPSGSEFPKHLIFYFANNSSLLMRDYYTNQVSLEKLDEMLKKKDFVANVDSITISGSASLVGSFQINSRLSHERAMALRMYIRWKHPGVYNDRIHVLPAVFNWDVLIDLVQRDPFVPNKEEVLRILNSSASNQWKVNQIKQLDKGVTDTYITTHFARYMRTATSVFFYFKEEQVKEPETMQEKNDSLLIGKVEEVILEPEKASETVPLIKLYRQKSYRSLFAVKTNLLYDLLSGLNVEIEVPIGNHFSVAGEWVFPWWLWEKKQYALEVLNGNLEFRYWWGNRTKDNLLTGWYMGIYGGAGRYDVEWKTKGYQGEFIIPFGLTGGFAHKISKNWRMEYSLGVGYMTNKYREYIPQKCECDDEWHLIKQKSGKFTWIGPTRARISLVWMINQNNKSKK